MSQTFGNPVADYIMPEFRAEYERASENARRNYPDWRTATDTMSDVYRRERAAHPRVICPTCGCEVSDFMMRDNDTCEYCELDMTPASPNTEDPMSQTQTQVQLFLHGHCFAQFTKHAPRTISAQVRDHLDAGWEISDARRFRCNGQSSFHVYFVRPHDKTKTATLVCSPTPASPSPEDTMNHGLTYVCIGCGYDTFNASRYCNACAVVAPASPSTPAEADACIRCGSTELPTPLSGICAYCTQKSASTPAEADDTRWITCLNCGSTIRQDEARLNGRCTCCTNDEPSTPAEEPLPSTADESLARQLAGGNPIAERIVSSWERDVMPSMREKAREIRQRAKTLAALATLALALTFTLPHGCTITGATGEGFPAGHCADGSYGYVDLDGTDGALGTVGDGRWVTLP